jgi:PAS domain S-box-containing protein
VADAPRALRPGLDADGQVAGALAIGRDITDRKRLLEQTQRLATAIEQAGETVMITDAKGIVQYVNPAFTRVTGYAREEILGRSPRHLVAGRQQARFYRNTLAELRPDAWRGRLTHKRKDGALIEEEATITPVRNEKGEIDGYVAVERDVTQQIILETRIRQAQKMEAVGRLASASPTTSTTCCRRSSRSSISSRAAPVPSLPTSSSCRIRCAAVHR